MIGTLYEQYCTVIRLKVWLIDQKAALKFELFLKFSNKIEFQCIHTQVFHAEAAIMYVAFISGKECETLFYYASQIYYPKKRISIN